MLVLCGQATAGKDTIREELLKLGFEPMVNYTTRPMREGEKNGVNYRYISEYDFQQKKENGDFAETTAYHTAYGVWHYGTDRHDIAENRVAILNPSGIKSLRRLGYSFYTIGLSVPEEIIRERMQRRNWSREEVHRRLEKDREDFADMRDFCDSIIVNDGTYSPEEIAGQIYAAYKQWLCEQGLVAHHALIF